MNNYGAVTSPELASLMTVIIDEVECRASFDEPAISAYQPEAQAELQFDAAVDLPQHAAEGLAERLAGMRRYASAITLCDALEADQSADNNLADTYAKRNVEHFEKSKLYFGRYEAEADEEAVVIEMMTFVAAAGKITAKLVDITIADSELNRVLTLHKTMRPDDQMLLTAALEAEDSMHPTLRAVFEYFEDTRQAETVAFALELFYDRLLMGAAGLVAVPPVLAEYMNGIHEPAMRNFVMAQVKRAQTYTETQEFEAIDPELKMPTVDQLHEFHTAIRSIAA